MERLYIFSPSGYDQSLSLRITDLPVITESRLLNCRWGAQCSGSNCSSFAASMEYMHTNKMEVAGRVHNALSNLSELAVVVVKGGAFRAAPYLQRLVAGFQPRRPGVRARVWSCGICGGQSGAGAGFLRVLRFPLPIVISPIAPQSSSSIIWGLYNRPEVAAVPRDLVPPYQ
jgi:hypothetical protein